MTHTTFTAENLTESNLTSMNFNRTHKVTIQMNGYGFSVKIGRRTWTNNLPSKFDIITDLLKLKDAGYDISFAINQYNTEIKTSTDATFEEMI